MKIILIVIHIVATRLCPLTAHHIIGIVPPVSNKFKNQGK